MRQAFRQFRSYPLQSALIITAIALGVAVLTAVATSLQASDSINVDQQKQLWNRELKLQATKDDQGAFYRGGSAVPVHEVGLLSDEKVVLTVDDLARVKEACPMLDYAYVSEWRTLSKVQKNGYTLNLDVTSATADYVQAAELKVAVGSLPSESDFAEQRNVIVVSQRSLEQLGLKNDIVGQQIQLTDWNGATVGYTVIGILQKPEVDLGGQEGNSLVPYTLPPWDGGNPRELHFAVDDPVKVDSAREQLVAFARSTWGERVTVSSNQLSDDGQFRLVNIVIASFASTALAAAALNIMNLMLARVLKRSHDIGIQRSLGASASAIIWRFLSEALVLGVIGGLLGITAGYVLHKTYENYQRTFYGEQSGFFTAIGFSPLAALIGFGVALVVSVVFGLYPAIRASRLRIIDALRDA